MLKAEGYVFCIVRLFVYRSTSISSDPLDQMLGWLIIFVYLSLLLVAHLSDVRENDKL